MGKIETDSRVSCYNIFFQPAPEKPRSRSKSGGKARARSSSPPSTKIHIGRLTRNVNREHLQEIFSTFGKIREIEFGSERMRPWLNKGVFKFKAVLDLQGHECINIQ